jgi:hypothetical protein
MTKTAILIGGHLRNMSEIIDNLSNHTISKYMNRSTYFKSDICDIEKLFAEKGLKIKYINIENQEKLKENISFSEYLTNNLIGRTLHGKNDTTYVRDIISNLFFQYYCHYKTFELIGDPCEYTNIIKTRPDMFYEDFDAKLLNSDIFFPNSHRMGGNSINSAFFGGKTEYMCEVLKYFPTILYNNGKLNKDIINKYHRTDINFNNLFKYYVIDYLMLKPLFCKFNPKVYRDKHNIINIT